MNYSLLLQHFVSTSPVVLKPQSVSPSLDNALLRGRGHVILFISQKYSVSVRKWNELEWNRNRMEGKGRELDELTGWPGISSPRAPCLSSQFHEASGHLFRSLPSESYLRVSGRASVFASRLKAKTAVEAQKNLQWVSVETDEPLGERTYFPCKKLPSDFLSVSTNGPECHKHRLFMEFFLKNKSCATCWEGR